VILILEGGASSISCSDTFAGPSAFSESETRDMANYYRSVANQVTVFISIHAFGQMLLVPYGHTTERLDNYDEAVGIGQLAINRLTARFGTAYTLGNIAETICEC
jgi:Zinc carboxypeptidase